MATLSLERDDPAFYSDAPTYVLYCYDGPLGGCAEHGGQHCSGHTPY